MRIEISGCMKAIERQSVGFAANTTKVKPVHVANGTFRVLLGKQADTNALHKFVFSKNQHGLAPKGHELPKVRHQLEELGRISGIGDEDLGRLREAIKSVVNADGAVFTGQMQSYSAASKHFVSRDTVGQEGGEFFGQWLLQTHPALSQKIVAYLEGYDDLHSVLCAPLFSEETIDFNSEYFQTIRDSPCPVAQEIQTGLTQVCESLNSHFEYEANSLLAMRVLVLFACFVVFNRLANLESLGQNNSEARRNLLLVDFTHSSDISVLYSSRECYNRILQSLSRFYSWAFTKELIALDEKWDELKSARIAYKAVQEPRNAQMREQEEYTQQWRLTVADVEDKPNPERLVALGATLYDLLASDNSRAPAGYLQRLGLVSGLLWPTTNLQRKSFRLHQDTLEMLLRGAVAPGETVTLDELQHRFKARYGILIGGRAADADDLAQAGIFGVDDLALEANRQAFVEQIQGLSMARLLADGVLQVNLTGAK